MSYQLAQSRQPLLMDQSRPGRTGCTLPALDVPKAKLPRQDMLRHDLPLPELSEGEVVRYFTRLSQLNYSVDTGFYPLGSCTMKYNPKWHEDAVELPGLAKIHPLQPEATAQGALQLMYELQEMLSEITGLGATSLTPAAGAQGELASMLVVRAYHRQRGDLARSKILIPDSAHGTNPASAAMSGFEVVTVPSNGEGDIGLDHLRSLMGPDVAGLMLTLPNTLGLFEPRIMEISRIVHEGGGLLYCDGANMNALVGQVKLGDLGFDAVHLNLHKTFGTPHGGGGPGAGPICVREDLADFLPSPVVVREEREGKAWYRLANPSQSIGRMSGFYGNFGVLVRGYAYIRTLGAKGLRQMSENAVINANYLLARLKDDYVLPYARRCMHEVVLSAARQRAKGVRALDVAKRLIDYGFHPPTMYFPLIVEEALMIEPTETEDKQTLDAFVEAMKAIAREAGESPEVVRNAPQQAPLTRLDEATAARKPDLRWKPKGDTRVNEGKG